MLWSTGLQRVEHNLVTEEQLPIDQSHDLEKIPETYQLPPPVLSFQFREISWEWNFILN